MARRNRESRGQVAVAPGELVVLKPFCFGGKDYERGDKFDADADPRKLAQLGRIGKIGRTGG